MFNYGSFPDAKAFADLSAKSLAPLARLAEITTASFEKAARFQAEAAIDVMKHGAARLQAAVQTAGSPYQSVARHTELTNEFVAASNQKWQEYVKFANDLQSDVTKWADETKSQVAAQFAPLTRQSV